MSMLDICRKNHTELIFLASLAVEAGKILMFTRILISSQVLIL